MSIPYRALGRSGLQVSPICFGGNVFGWTVDEKTTFELLDAWVDAGFNFVDTADVYSRWVKGHTGGESETLIGRWFKASGKRHRVVLATKIGKPMGVGPEPRQGLSAAYIRAEVEESLKRLQTDYIDLYQLHWPDRPVAMFGATGLAYKHVEGNTVPIDEILGALQTHVKAGKIRHIGLSNETAWGTMQFLHHSQAKGLPRVQSIQNAYNLINRIFELGQAEIAHREQVGLLAYSPLGQGYLTGKYQKGAQPEGSRKKLFNRLQRYEKPQTEPAIDRYLAIAKQHGLDPAQFALQFVTTRPFVTSNIIGATTMEQLKTNIDSINVKWTDELEKAVDDAHHAQPNPAP